MSCLIAQIDECCISSRVCALCHGAIKQTDKTQENIIYNCLIIAYKFSQYQRGKYHLVSQKSFSQIKYILL